MKVFAAPALIALPFLSRSLPRLRTTPDRRVRNEKSAPRRNHLLRHTRTFLMSALVPAHQETTMKIHYYLPLAASIACLSLTVQAQDPASPGKSGDAPREPAARAPERPGDLPGDAPRQPGKESDAVNERIAESRFRGKITSLDKEEKTVTLDDAGKGSHTVHIGPDTKLKKGSETATWNDLAVGKEVEGTCSRMGDKFHAATLKLTK
jgi:hypothetical protein